MHPSTYHVSRLDARGNIPRWPSTPRFRRSRTQSTRTFSRHIEIKLRSSSCASTMPGITVAPWRGTCFSPPFRHAPSSGSSS